MTTRTTRLRRTLEHALAWLVLAVVMTFTFAKFFRVPYAGFLWDATDGRIYEIYVPNAALQVDDQLLQVGEVTLQAFQADLRLQLFEGLRAGDVAPLLVERDGQALPVAWEFPGFNRQEFLVRLDGVWWLAYAFWLAGAMTVLFVRPSRDDRWQLLAAFNFLMALVIAVGAGVSRWHVWESAIVLRSCVWLALPVFWHLHWVFPQPLGRLPRALLWAIYLPAGALAVAEWFQAPPPNLYFLGFLLAVAGSLLLLVLHFVIRPAQRRDVGVLLVVFVLALLPALGISLAGVVLGTIPPLAAMGLLALGALPFTYLYAAYRRQLGALELRVNRLFSLYLFFILLGPLVLIAIALADARLETGGAATLVGLGAALVTAIAIIAGFPRFQRLVERRLLGMPLEPTYLLPAYASRITTCLDAQSLVRLLSGEVLPTLLVRQSALIALQEDGSPTTVYAVGVAQDRLPAERVIPSLIAEAGQVRKAPPADTTQLCPWVHLALPLLLGGETSGLWLLGRRDPDDHYAPTEIPILQALADQTAVALANITHAQRLRALHRANIERHEEERARLARELHDEVLGDITALNLRLDESGAAAHIGLQLHGLAEHVRQVVHDLRPPMLTYGLRAALEGLADDLAERSPDGPDVTLAVPETTARYDLQAEQHLYRILQQAGENALRHAQAQSIRIHGRLAPDEVDLTVEDDGVGFEHGTQPDLDWLLEHKHYGLAGMLERAALIGAQMQIDSAPGRGARVRVRWHPAHPSTSLGASLPSE